MSTSSLWTMGEDFKGGLYTEFNDSFILSPIIFDVLFNKYMPGTVIDNDALRKLNDVINICNNDTDRIVWEFFNQQIFNTDNQILVAEAIRGFLLENEEYSKGIEECVKDELENIASEILGLECYIQKYFIFKNSSCDDNVEFWFEECYEDGVTAGKLSDLKEDVCEFVIIENDKITGFKSNIEFIKDELSKR